MLFRAVLLATALHAATTLQVALPTRQGSRAPTPVAAADNLGLTKGELIARLKEVGLKTTGKKSELLKRLDDFAATPPDVSQAAESLLAFEDEWRGVDSLDADADATPWFEETLAVEPDPFDEEWRGVDSLDADADANPWFEETLTVEPDESLMPAIPIHLMGRKLMDLPPYAIPGLAILVYAAALVASHYELLSF